MQEMQASKDQTPIRVERWSTEIPLLVLIILASLAIWLVLAISVLGIIYVAFIGLFIFLTRVSFIAYIRGSAVKLGPDQFPHLYERVVALSKKAGLSYQPAAYLMEAGGSLNAFATRFFRSRFIVLFSDLVEACGDDETARDMIIGHEIGHLRARHLDWWWLIAPGSLVPFLGSAYSRAREFTCDRYGSALCGDAAGATRGLTLLAAGRQHGFEVNLDAYVAQSRDLQTGWMTLGKWFSGYPPLCDRVAALQPKLAASRVSSVWGPVRAFGIMASVVALPVLFGVFFASIALPMWQQRMQALTDSLATDIDSSFDSYEVEPYDGDVEQARAQVDADFEALIAIVREHVAAGGEPPVDSDDLDYLWNQERGGQAPRDPFDDLQYGFYADDDGELVLWSTGPDREVSTDDDIERRFAVTVASG